ncbi:Fic family protein [Cryobacterium sp. PH31-L1]|uniref:Fic family protein n=1 Tax=Cryobacterium sp. PH31-L1 TaxID=3046199 RepID=UPI0024BAD20A|nr:Fic family protein [Cryobacterium sp. PH31-L1]MDJ0375918.1 Fic family protein [Cryobacterium sp. PH31-L1]
MHPFADGNGRTGRILNLLFLMQAGLFQYPVLHSNPAQRIEQPRNHADLRYRH